MSIEAATRPAEIPTEPRYRRDAFLLGLDLATFTLGLAFASPNTLIPAFAERLGAPNVVIGAIPALMSVGWMLPAIFAANYTQGLARKLPFVLRYTVFERLPYVVLGIGAIWLAPLAPGLTLALLLTLLAVMTVTGGLLMPAWLDVIGSVVPVGARGRFFALANGAGALLGLVGAAGVGILLDSYGYPLGYGLCFLVGSVFLGLSYVALAMVREPPRSAPSPRLPITTYLRRLPALLRADPNMTRFLAARALAVCGQMGSGFYAAYALKELGAADVEVGIFTSLVLAAQTAGNLFFGWLADRRGHLVVLTLGALVNSLASGLALMAVGVVALYPSFVFMGLSIAAMNVSGMAIGMEFGPEAERPTYVAINNSSVAPFALVAPLVGGVLADQLGYGALFAVGTMLSLAGAVALRLGARDPRHTRAVS